MHRVLGVLAQPRGGGGAPTSGSGQTLLRGASDIWSIHNRALKQPHFNICEMDQKSGLFGEKVNRTLKMLKRPESCEKE